MKAAEEGREKPRAIIHSILQGLTWCSVWLLIRIERLRQRKGDAVLLLCLRVCKHFSQHGIAQYSAVHHSAVQYNSTQCSVTFLKLAQADPKGLSPVL